MTFEDFEIKVSKKTSFEKYWYYCISIGIMVLSLSILSRIITYSRKFSALHLFVYYSGTLFLFLLSAYGIYLLPNRYKTIVINSDLPIEKKQHVVTTLLKELGVYRRMNDDHYYSFTLRKGFWTMPYDVYLFFDKNSFAFSMQGQDSTDGGFIDFGAAERKRNGIADRIVELATSALSAANISFPKPRV